MSGWLFFERHGIAGFDDFSNFMLLLLLIAMRPFKFGCKYFVYSSLAFTGLLLAFKRMLLAIPYLFTVRLMSAFTFIPYKYKHCLNFS
jgi:hypothetical protein